MLGGKEEALNPEEHSRAAGNALEVSLDAVDDAHSLGELERKDPAVGHVLRQL